MSFSDCRFHVSVTPYQKQLVPDGVQVTNALSFDPKMLTRCDWPPSEPCRRIPEGGASGELVEDNFTLSWHQNKLIYPFSSDPKPLAEKKDETQILYLASFLAYLDGQVAYVPVLSSDLSANGNKNKIPHYLILVESPVAEIHAIKFFPNQAVIIDPFVKHSMPIPVQDNLEFIAWHRAINGSLSAEADPAGFSKIIVNLNKVDRMKPISIRKIGPSISSFLRGQTKVKNLDKNFSSDLRTLENASTEAIAPYGYYIHDFSAHFEQITTLPWPGSDSSCHSSGVLEQDFLVTWRSPLDHSLDKLELEFEGLSGSFIGEKGRPGVEYNTELGVYKADLLMARPDGSFYIQPSDHNSIFAIALALPSSDDGNPIKETLRVFTFEHGSTLRLDPKVWHSVPIPLASTHTSILFREIVAATNANLVINVKAESGHSIQFVQGI